MPGLVASANRDERVFERADELLPGRDKGNQHLSFGYGLLPVDLTPA